MHMQLQNNIRYIAATSTHAAMCLKYLGSGKRHHVGTNQRVAAVRVDPPGESLLTHRHSPLCRRYNISIRKFLHARTKPDKHRSVSHKIIYACTSRLLKCRPAHTYLNFSKYSRTVHTSCTHSYRRVNYQMKAGNLPTVDAIAPWERSTLFRLSV